MIENKSLIYGLVIISGFILVWLIYAEQGIDTNPDLTHSLTYINCETTKGKS